MMQLVEFNTIQTYIVDVSFLNLYKVTCHFNNNVLSSCYQDLMISQCELGGQPLHSINLNNSFSYSSGCQTIFTIEIN